MFRKIDESISVSPQITPAQVAEAAKQGFTFIINNRPEHEEPGQPTADEIEAAATAAGLGYRAIPILPGRFGEAEVVAMAEALAAAPGPVLAFCRSGTRSTLVWALARARSGDDFLELSRKAEGAGYDLTPIRSFF